MSNRYLAQLQSLCEKSEKGHPQELPKLSKPGFGSFDSDHSAPFSKFSAVFAELERCCPDHVPAEHWRQAVEDGRRFLIWWAEQAERLGWTARDLFGLHQPPAKPHPSYSRLSRYDATGLIWLLRGRPVTVLTEATAAIENPTGAITIYRKHNKPALGPPGDSTDDF